MIGSSHLFGGFSISPALARRVFDAISEMHAQTLDPALSHTDDDNCDICKAARAVDAGKTENAQTPTDPPGRRWTA
jgi:hypothetical protein